MLTRSLLSQMWNARFSEMSRQPDAPFLKRVPAVECQPDSGVVRRLCAGEGWGDRERAGGDCTEIGRVKQFGFNQSELDRAKASARPLRARLQRARQGGERGLASELVTYYLTGEAAPGIETELKLAREFVPLNNAWPKWAPWPASSSPTPIASSWRRRRRRPA